MEYIQNSLNFSDEKAPDEVTFQQTENQQFQHPLNNYQSKTEEATSALHSLIDSDSTNREATNRKRWERVAAFEALSNIFSSIGKGVVAAHGIDQTPVSGEYIDYAIAQVEKSDQRARDDYDQNFKVKLTEALRGVNRSEELDDRYAERLDEKYELESKNNLTRYSIDQTTARNSDNNQARKEQLEINLNSKWPDIKSGDSLSSSQRKAASSLSKSDRWGQNAEPERVVFGLDGEKVYLMAEDVTRIHEGAKKLGLDIAYKNATNETSRKHEYDVMIQNTYTHLEKIGAIK